jgi:hypothetical protein
MIAKIWRDIWGILSFLRSFLFAAASHHSLQATMLRVDALGLGSYFAQTLLHPNIHRRGQ